MTDKKYNGWTNYQTWAVKLWLDNDEGTVALQQEMLEEARLNWGYIEGDGEIIIDDDTTPYLLEGLVEQWVTDNNPLAGTASMYADLMGSAINQVNFREIAARIIDDEN